METLKEKLVKASKQHICTYCGEPIERGEHYKFYNCVEDHKMMYFREHEVCADACGYAYMKNEYDYDMTDEEVRDYNADVYFEAHPHSTEKSHKKIAEYIATLKV